MIKTASLSKSGNSEYQREMAVSLVKDLGKSAAISFCSQNGWNGTLSVILTQNT